MAILTVGGYIVFKVPEARTVYGKLRSLWSTAEPASLSA
jgi:hypothetical protein